MWVPSGLEKETVAQRTPRVAGIAGLAEAVKASHQLALWALPQPLAKANDEVYRARLGHHLGGECGTGLRMGIEATEGLSRGSTATWAPGRSKRYCRPVTGPVTVSPVLPMYSKTVPG